jgi:hypothetical protein
MVSLYQEKNKSYETNLIGRINYSNLCIAHPVQRNGINPPRKKQRKTLAVFAYGNGTATNPTPKN